LHYASRARPTRDHAALKAALDAWFDEVKKAQWSTAANIKGNDYRLVVAVDFEKASGGSNGSARRESTTRSM
jgi:mRNA interferase HigB